MHVVQEPVRVSLGTRRVWKGNGSKRRYVEKEDEMVYIPLLESLKSLLQNKQVLSEVCVTLCTFTSVCYAYLYYNEAIVQSNNS